MNSEPSLSRRTGQRRLVWAIAAAVLANLVLFATGSAAGATWETNAPSPVNAVTVAGTTILAMLVGGLVSLALDRRRPGLLARLRWVGLVFALVSMAGAFLATEDLITSLWLASMHVATGLAWFLWLREPRTR